MPDCVILPLFNQHAQSDDGPLKREDMRATPPVNQNFSLVLMNPLQQVGLDRMTEEQGRFPNSVETNFG
jgi:hypothetical protein